MTAPLLTTPMRDAETLTPPTFELPTGSCDSHLHVFEVDYPHVAEPLYTFPDATVEQYLRVAHRLNLDRMVLVQPTYYGTDNRLLTDVLERIGPRGRGVVQIGEELPDSELVRYHARGVRAIRLDLFARATWPPREIAAYVTRMAERARPLGWHIQFYSPGTVVRDLLPFLADLEDPFVIDHMGYMLEADGLTRADFSALLDVLGNGNCWIKLSGPYRIAKEKPLDYVRPIARALIEARPDRLIWGSDWPHLPNGQRDTGQLLNLLADWAPDEAERHLILVDSPKKLFFDDLGAEGIAETGEAGDHRPATLEPTLQTTSRTARSPAASSRRRLRTWLRRLNRVRRSAPTDPSRPPMGPVRPTGDVSCGATPARGKAAGRVRSGRRTGNDTAP